MTLPPSLAQTAAETRLGDAKTRLKRLRSLVFTDFQLMKVGCAPLRLRNKDSVSARRNSQRVTAEFVSAKFTPLATSFPSQIRPALLVGYCVRSNTLATPTMARGRYELPSAYQRPIYGPRRPPRSPLTTALTPASQVSATCPPTTTAVFRTSPTIVVVCLSTCDYGSTEIASLRSHFDGQMLVESVTSVGATLLALSHHPHAVLLTHAALTNTLHDPLRQAAARYVQSGGVLITEFSQIYTILRDVRTDRRPSDIEVECRTTVPHVPFMSVEAPLT